MRCAATIWNSRLLRDERRPWLYVRKLRHRPLEKGIRKLGVLPPIGFEIGMIVDRFPINCDIVRDHARKAWFQYYSHLEDWVRIPEGSIRFDRARHAWFRLAGNRVDPSDRPADWDPLSSGRGSAP